MMMMKEKRVHAVWAWWLIDGHRNLSCLEDIQTWDQSWFLSRPSQNIFFLAAATHRLPSLVPQPTCSWKWHPDTCRLGNPTTFTLSSWKGSEGIEITRKIYLISTSEIKARKEQFDHEAYPVPSIFSLSVQVLSKCKAHHKTPYRRAFAWESDFISRAVLELPPVECTQFSWYPAFPSGEKSWYGNSMRRDDPSFNIRSTHKCWAGRTQSLSWKMVMIRVANFNNKREKELSFKKVEIVLFSKLNYHFLSQLQFSQYWAKLREVLLQSSRVRVAHFVKYNIWWSWWWWTSMEQNDFFADKGGLFNQ